MKTRMIIIGCILIILFFLGCGSEIINDEYDDLELPTYDLTGIWAGSLDDYDGDNAISFHIYITQEQNNLYGTLRARNWYDFNTTGRIEAGLIYLDLVCDIDPSFIINFVGEIRDELNDLMIFGRWEDSYGTVGLLRAYYNIK
jgi:hypothetical protein